MNSHPTSPCHYTLCFQPLAPEGTAFTFPCDAQGRVDLDGLDDPTRREYLFARALMGRDLARPAVRLSAAR